MNNKSIVLIIFGMLAILGLSCSQASQASEPKISHDRAIMIAATNVPYRVIRSSGTIVMLNDDTWIISFSLSGNATVNKSELNWPEGPSTSFVNNHLPPDNYSLLTFSIDGNTGEITSRNASDTIIIGGPGVFYTKPRPIIQEAWFPILTAIAGVLVGGLAVWLFMRRKMKAN